MTTFSFGIPYEDTRNTQYFVFAYLVEHLSEIKPHKLNNFIVKFEPFVICDFLYQLFFFFNCALSKLIETFLLAVKLGWGGGVINVKMSTFHAFHFL